MPRLVELCPPLAWIAPLLIAGWVLTAAAPPVAVAQTNGETAPPAAPAVPSEQSSPRAVLMAFLERMSRDDKKAAFELLDMSGVPAEAVGAKSSELPYRLLQLMKRFAEVPSYDDADPDTWRAQFDGVPTETEGNRAWSLAEMPGDTSEEAGQIKIAMLADGRWAFSADTVKAIEDLSVETQDQAPLTVATAATEEPSKPWSVWYGELFPLALQKEHFILPTYQWLSLIVIAIAGRLMEVVTRRGFTWLSDVVLHHYDPEFFESTATVWKPIGRLAAAATWYGGAYAIGFPLRFVGLLLIVLKVVTVVAAVLAAFAVIRLVAGYLTRRAKRTQQKFDDLMIPVAATTARILAVAIGIIVVTAAFSEELPATLIGGLGIGGVAIALASQETLSNFFGSVTVLFDRPFEVGDWVVVDGIEGEVESLGFRSTRIRTGLNSQITLPNNKLATAAIDNWGRRRYRRYLTRLGVEYHTTPEQVDAFCEGVRELIRRQPHTRKDFYAVYFNDFGASALEILMVVYFEAPDWPTELRERHRLLTDILRLAERLEVGFAFPTQTVHLHRGGETPTPPSMNDATLSGQVAAANIAGELLNYQDRPGRVKFTGPAAIDLQGTAANGKA
ncbi:MAG: mechanosensitive ion channel family protein [Planctomycetota bacterium]